MKENWKSVVGYEGLYEVSDLGRVRSLNYRCSGKVKVLKPGTVKSGYYVVHLIKNGKQKLFYVHRLVVEAFRGPIPKGMVVNHLNEIKTDNRLTNLEICSVKQNINHGSAPERMAKAKSKQLNLTLADYPYTKLTFPSSYEAGDFFGYKHKKQLITLLCHARKRGENYINIKGKQYFFEQHQSGKNEALTKFSELT